MCDQCSGGCTNFDTTGHRIICNSSPESRAERKEALTSKERLGYREGDIEIVKTMKPLMEIHKMDDMRAARKYSEAEQQLFDEKRLVEHYQKIVDDFNEGLDYFEKRHPDIIAEFQFRFDPAKNGVRRLSLVTVQKTLFHRDPSETDLSPLGFPMNNPGPAPLTQEEIDQLKPQSEKAV